MSTGRHGGRASPYGRDGGPGSGPQSGWSKPSVEQGHAAKETGFPSGGFYASDPAGNTLRGKAKYGEMPQRHKTFEKAEEAARKEMSKWK